MIDIWMRWEDDGGMSEDIKIHHLDHYLDQSCSQLRLPLDMNGSSYDWKKVTCGECRLEMPLAKPERAPEYRVPQHVKDMDVRLGLADELAAAERDYTEAMARAALAAREANAAAAAAARIRTLLAERGSGVGQSGVQPSWAAQGLSGGRERTQAEINARLATLLSKPGPY